MGSVEVEARTRRRRAIAIVVASGAPAALELGHAFGRGGPVEWSYVAFVTVATLISMIALTATFDRALRRRLPNARVFALAGAVAIGLGIAEAFAGWAISSLVGLPIVMQAHRSIEIVARMGAVDGLLVLALWALAVVLPFAVGDAHARAREADALRDAAELARLRANLQPHFLFNTLSTVAGLIGEDPREARRLIGALGDLLRDSLVDGDDTRTLGDEITWLQHYAEILETRHRGSLRFSWDIAVATRGARIPRLLLQPLVENAVRHGALRRPDGGEVAVRTTIDAAARITCVVEDNGPGLARAPREGALGLSLVTRRLALAYAGAAAFRLESVDGRTRAIVNLPAEAT